MHRNIEESIDPVMVGYVLGENDRSSDDRGRPRAGDDDLAPVREPRGVLLVDDDIDFLESLQELLELRGYSVYTADNVASARQTAESHTPGAALIDIKLGAEDGVELVPELKRISPGMLCVLVTAYTYSGHADRAFDSGADEFISKPIAHARLFQILSDFFDTGRE